MERVKSKFSHFLERISPKIHSTFQSCKMLKRNDNSVPTRPSASHAGGRRFESCRAHHSFQTLPRTNSDLLIIKQGDTIQGLFVDESFQAISSGSGLQCELRMRRRIITVVKTGLDAGADNSHDTWCDAPEMDGWHLEGGFGSARFPSWTSRVRPPSPAPCFHRLTGHLGYPTNSSLLRLLH